MSDNPVNNFSDLMDRFDALIEDAGAGPVDPVIVDYLRATRERVVLLHNRVAEKRRVAERYETEGDARLVIGGEALEVAIVDRSATGFGLLADEPVAPETNARLEIDGQYQEQIYEGLVAYCQAQDDRYRVGLDVVSSLWIG